jgi:hypothetical protein
MARDPCLTGLGPPSHAPRRWLATATQSPSGCAPPSPSRLPRPRREAPHPSSLRASSHISSLEHPQESCSTYDPRARMCRHTARYGVSPTGRSDTPRRTPPGSSRAWADRLVRADLVWTGLVCSGRTGDVSRRVILVRAGRGLAWSWRTGDVSRRVILVRAGRGRIGWSGLVLANRRRESTDHHGSSRAWTDPLVRPGLGEPAT